MSNEVKRVKAEYRKECSQYAGNPYIEALPPIPDSSSNSKHLLNLPLITQDDLSQSKYQRITMLGALRRFNFPMPRAESLMVDIYSLIKQGYSGCNPVSGDDLAQVREIDQEIREEFDSWEGRIEDLNEKIENDEKTVPEVTSQNYVDDTDFYNTTADNLLFVGVSGIGKTNALRRMLWFVPDVIVHTEYQGKRLIRTQIPILHIETPYQGGEKELCLSILQAFDEVLENTHYYEEGKKAKVTTVELTIFVGKLARKYGVGIFIFDEAQNLIKGKKGGGKRFQGFILFATNVWKVPFVLVGTPKLEKLFKSNFRTLRRVCSFGAIKWDRLNNGELFHSFVRTMWNLQLTRTYTPLSDQIVDALYECSQGIVQMVVSVFLRTQRNVIMDKRNKSEVITPELIRDTFRKDFVPVHKAIQAIKRNDYGTMENFGDIMLDLEDSFRIEDKESEMDIGIIEAELKKRQRENTRQVVMDALYDCRKECFPRLCERDLKNITKMIVNQSDEGCQVSQLIAMATVEAIRVNEQKAADTKERAEAKKLRRDDGIATADRTETGKIDLERKGFIGGRDEFLA